MVASQAAQIISADVEAGEKLLKSSPPVDFDVLICGAGPVGLAAAISLAQKGISCRLIDLNFKPVIMTKASGTHPRTLELLPRPVVRKMLSESLPVTAARMYENDGNSAEPAELILAINMANKSDTFSGIAAMEQATFSDSHPQCPLSARLPR